MSKTLPFVLSGHSSLIHASINIDFIDQIGENIFGHISVAIPNLTATTLLEALRKLAASKSFSSTFYSSDEVGNISDHLDSIDAFYQYAEAAGDETFYSHYPFVDHLPADDEADGTNIVFCSPLITMEIYVAPAKEGWASITLYAHLREQDFPLVEELESLDLEFGDNIDTSEESAVYVLAEFIEKTA